MTETPPSFEDVTVGAELADVNSEYTNELIQFKEGEKVLVPRAMYKKGFDGSPLVGENGKKIVTGYTKESGWEVASLGDSGKVRVRTSEPIDDEGHYLEKTVNAEFLASIQPIAPAESADHFAEAAQRIVGERKGLAAPEMIEQNEKLQDAIEDLGEEALDAAGVDKPIEGAKVEVQETETGPYDYLRKALPPVVRPKIEENFDFDNLFGNDEQYQQGIDSRNGHYEPETEEQKQQKYYDKYVTEENREQSRALLGEALKATPAIGEVLQRAGLDPNSVAAVDAIREDPNVRFEVAKIIAQKLDTLADSPDTDMGWRVVKNPSNNLKVDQVTGKRYDSRTYATALALKMIDGEFSRKLESNDQARDAEGRVAIGQHRHAAVLALMSRYA